MAATIRRVSYFTTAVQDRPGEAYLFLSLLAREGVSLLSVSAIPMGSSYTELWIFPESVADLERVAARTGLDLKGPQHAFLVVGDDQLGALVDIHRQLSDAGINVYASTGVSTGDRYGYVIYVAEGDFEAAAGTLGV